MEIKYSENKKTAIFNGYTFTKDKHTGYYLSTVNIGERRKRLHVFVWETYHGEIPTGFEVHHADFNKNNNEPENLVLLSREEHHRIHAESLTDEERKARAENVTKNAMPKAKEWHKSEAGHLWHKQHGQEVFGSLEPIKYTCTNCGKEFETRRRYQAGSNTFCCNNCKSAFRRKSGVDDVIKICKVCGREYKANKYQNTSKCEVCKGKSGNRK